MGPTFGTSRSSSSPGTGGATEGESETPRPPASAPSFAVPGAYGQGTQQFTGGEGRLARPRFRYTAQFSIGFDDNIFQTPTETQGVPDLVIRQQVTPGSPELTILVPVEPAPRTGRIIAPLPPPQPVRFRTVTIPAVEPEFEEIVVPGFPAAERQGSLVTRGNLGFEMTFASRRTLFTFDFKGGGDIYWNRPDDKVEYNLVTSLIFSHRITQRLQFSAVASAAYLTQPDFSRINSPTQQTGSAYINANTKFDLSYRWAPRFSTVGSLSFNTLLFDEKTLESGNYLDTTFGLEARYLFSPRFILIGEGRYSTITYDSSTFNRDSNTVFALLGAESSLSRRLTSSVRLGASLRTFEASGKSSTTPYFEGALTYQLGRASLLRLSTRFGFEEPPDATTEVLTARLGYVLNHAFSARLRGSVAGNYIHRSQTNEVADSDLTNDLFDASLGLDYALTRRWSFNAFYTFTMSMSSIEVSDYYRNRIFMGVEYEF